MEPLNRNIHHAAYLLSDASGSIDACFQVVREFRDRLVADESFNDEAKLQEVNDLIRRMMQLTGLAASVAHGAGNLSDLFVDRD